MAKIRFLNIYKKYNTMIPSMGDTNFGHYLGFPGFALMEKLKKFNIQYTVGNDFDIILFIDLDEENFLYAKSLPKSVKKILITAESPIYCKYTHMISILFDKIWSAVITYNREISSRKILHYDIPITGIQCTIPNLTSLENSSNKGIFVGVYKGKDIRGNNKYRDLLMLRLANNNEIVIFGKDWPIAPGCFGITDNKPKTISDYRYSIVVENVKTSGYVTEKLPDSILGERPALYFGDVENARKRFGNTFVPMQSLTYDAFLEARQSLFENYYFYYENCLIEKSESEKWIESFLTSTIFAIV